MHFAKRTRLTIDLQSGSRTSVKYLKLVIHVNYIYNYGYHLIESKLFSLQSQIG
jgi:hypothetical protein